jgi:hypothetical protein
MLSVEKCDLPEKSLLSVYRSGGAYTDCYATDINKRISQGEYIRAFYTTTLFKIERTILKWAVAKPSTDKEAFLLAEAKVEKFAAWNVEARQDDQILLSDYRGRTRSWLMSEPTSSKDGDSTRLYFGSAVVPIHVKEDGKRTIGKSFGVLLRFHRLYSRALLSSAKSRLTS